MIPIDAQPLLQRLRVVDASRVLAGPFAGQTLAELGAEVIKIERPGRGDETRGWGPPFAGPLSAYFLSCNRNKRSLTLDLERPEGQTLLHQLLDQADVLLENFRHDSLDKLGLTTEKLLERHPQLIVCSISGFGRRGPWHDQPGYDFAIQALSGLMAITGPAAGPPSKVGVAITDVVTGLYATIAVLACIRARQQSGHGYAIDLALLDCAVAAQVNVVQAYLTAGVMPPRQGNAHLQIVPYQLFGTADGHLVIAVGNDAQFRRFCGVLGRPELAEDARFATNADRVRQRDTLVPMLEAILARRPTAEWRAALSAANIPQSEVLDYPGLFATEHTQERGLKLTIHDPAGNPVELAASPFHIQGTTAPPPSLPPELGADTSAILGEWLGLDAEAVEKLKRARVV